MTSLALISAAAGAPGITAVTLPGTAGAADGDMYVQVLSHSDIEVQRSTNGSTWSDSSASTGGQQVQIFVPAGSSIRLVNRNAVTARNAHVAYRYAGSPS